LRKNEREFSGGFLGDFSLISGGILCAGGVLVELFSGSHLFKFVFQFLGGRVFVFLFFDRSGA